MKTVFGVMAAEKFIWIRGTCGEACFAFAKVEGGGLVGYAFCSPEDRGLPRRIRNIRGESYALKRLNTNPVILSGLDWAEESLIAYCKRMMSNILPRIPELYAGKRKRNSAFLKWFPKFVDEVTTRKVSAYLYTPKSLQVDQPSASN